MESEGRGEGEEEEDDESSEREEIGLNGRLEEIVAIEEEFICRESSHETSGTCSLVPFEMRRLRTRSRNERKVLILLASFFHCYLRPVG